MTEKTSVETLLQQGHNKLDRGQNQVALDIFQQAIALEPQNPQVLYGLGLSYFRLEQEEEAIAPLTQALQIQPLYLLALARRGLAYQSLKQTELARADFEKAIQIEPQDHEGWLGRGQAFDGLERYEDAISDFNQAIALQVNDYSVYNWQGYTLCKLGRDEEAISDFNQAIALQPDDYYAYHWRGNALNNLGHYQEAISDYNQAIALQPDYYYAYKMRGNALYSLGHYQEAISDYNQALTLQPDDHYAYKMRGNALYSLGRYQEAINNYNQALALQPDYHDAYHNRGLALWKLGRYQEAISDFNQAIFLKADYWSAWDNLGWLYFQTNRYDEALKAWNDGLLKLQPRAPEHQEGCGNLHHSKGKYYYQHGKKQTNPFQDWLNSKVSYETALKYFEGERFLQKRLEVLQDLIQVCQYLIQPRKVEELLREGTDILDGWLQSPHLSLGRKIQLQKQFAGFDQVRVDTLAQSSELAQQIKALELAEQRKNTCIAWLKQQNSSRAPILPYSRMQDLLNPRTAAIYWHISPTAITTFILKHQQPPLVLKYTSAAPTQRQSSQQFFGKPEKPYPANADQLRRFEAWMDEWKQDYQKYQQANLTDASNHQSSLKTDEQKWRQKMEFMLFNRLRHILEINRILEDLKDENLDQLILIPHRELHLLPLHVLFPERFTISYLPSFQIGLNLQQLPIFLSEQERVGLLNVENPSDNLIFDTIESVALSHLYPGCHQLKTPVVTKQILLEALKNNTAYFHFTGHSYHQPEEPRESALVLAESDILTLGDIFDEEDLNLSQYQLICLSACETGITSKDKILDEYVGLVSGFLAKDASYVLSTLWKVDERATALLIIEFYQLLKQGKTPIQALKQAQNWLHSKLTYKKLSQWYRNLISEIQNTNTLRTKYDICSCIAYLETEALIIETDQVKMESTELPFSDLYYWASFILTGKPD